MRGTRYKCNSVDIMLSLNIKSFQGLRPRCKFLVCLQCFKTTTSMARIDERWNRAKAHKTRIGTHRRGEAPSAFFRITPMPASTLKCIRSTRDERRARLSTPPEFPKKKARTSMAISHEIQSSRVHPSLVSDIAQRPPTPRLETDDDETRRRYRSAIAAERSVRRVATGYLSGRLRKARSELIYAFAQWNRPRCASRKAVRLAKNTRKTPPSKISTIKVGWWSAHSGRDRIGL